MMTFWILSALMLAVAMLFIVLPLWRSGSRSNAVQRESANLEIFRDQVAEMDADLGNGLLTQEMHEQGKRELQLRLLDEVGDAHNAGAIAVRNPHKLLAIILAVLLPVTAIGVYWKVGNQHAMIQENTSVSEGFGSVRSAAALQALEEKVAAQPDDAESLFQLARSYSELERFADAVQAYEKLTRLVPNEAQLWADYADVQAMSSGRSLRGTPTKLLNKALALDPLNFKALALSGSAAMERGDYAMTIGYWEKLLQMIPKDNENAKIIESGIQEARVLMAQKGGAKLTQKSQRSGEEPKAQALQSGKEAVSGTVEISEALKGQADPNDTLFVLVRAAQGSKMPLAIVRKQVKDLPLKFKLDDSSAMSPEMKLSNFEQVIVIARVSKSGNAMTQAGDFQGMSKIIKPGAKGVNINIDQVLP